MAVSRLNTEPKGILKINDPMSFGTMHLAPAIADFMVQYPDLTLQVTLDDRFVDPIQEGFDAIIRIPEPPNTASLVVHPITKVKSLMCAVPSYLAKYNTPKHPL